MRLGIFFVMTLLVAGLAESKPILTVSCAEPKGTRFDYGKGLMETGMKLKTSKDGFKGVNPIFVIDDEKPKRMLVIWGDTKRNLSMK